MSWRPRETETYQTRGDIVDFRPEIMLDLASQAPPLQERVFQPLPSLPLAATMYRDTPVPSMQAEKRKLSPRSVVNRVMRERFPAVDSPQRSAGITRSRTRAGVEHPLDHVHEAISAYAEIEKMQSPLQRRLKDDSAPSPFAARAPLQRRLRDQPTPLPFAASAPLQRRLRDQPTPSPFAASAPLQRRLKDDSAPSPFAARAARPRSAAPGGPPPTNRQQSAPRDMLGSSRHLARSSRFW